MTPIITNMQKTYIVTMRRVYKNRDHDPNNKQIGECPLSGVQCSDITGNHHNVLITGVSIAHANAQANKYQPDWQVSRIERVN